MKSGDKHQDIYAGAADWPHHFDFSELPVSESSPVELAIIHSCAASRWPAKFQSLIKPSKRKST